MLALMAGKEIDAVRPPGETGPGLARGVCRGLYHLGFVCLTEFRLTSRRRVDVFGMDAGGLIVIVEVKTSPEDFRADRKWPEYQDFCDHFFFAVPESFPAQILPEGCGLLIADAYGAAIVREAPPLRLSPARRRVQTLRFGQTAALRLARYSDPDPVARHVPRESPAPGLNGSARLL